MDSLTCGKNHHSSFKVSLSHLPTPPAFLHHAPSFLHLLSTCSHTYSRRPCPRSLCLESAFFFCHCLFSSFLFFFPLPLLAAFSPLWETEVYGHRHWQVYPTQPSREHLSCASMCVQVLSTLALSGVVQEGSPFLPGELSWRRLIFLPTGGFMRTCCAYGNLETFRYIYPASNVNWCSHYGKQYRSSLKS